MATITTTKTSHSSSSSAVQSPPSTDRANADFRLCVVYSTFLPTNFCSKLPTVAILFSEIFNVNGNSTTFVQDWFPAVVLPRVWRVVKTFFQSWEIDESLLEPIESRFSDGSSDEIMRAVKDLLALSKPHSPTDELTFGRLKGVVKGAFEDDESLALNLAFTGVLAPLDCKALETSPTLWREIYPERITKMLAVANLVVEATRVCPTSTALIVDWNCGTASVCPRMSSSHCLLFEVYSTQTL
jgi:hypothetical protein